jgi:hypothetical protein
MILKRVTVILFITEDAEKILKTIGAHTESTDLIFKTFKKFIHLVTLSLERLESTSLLLFSDNGAF